MTFLQLPKPGEFAHVQRHLLLFPGVECGVTHLDLPTEGTDKCAGVGLSDRVQDLFIRALRGGPMCLDRMFHSLSGALR